MSEFEPTPAQLAAGLHESNAVIQHLQRQIQQLQQARAAETQSYSLTPSPAPGAGNKEKEPTPVRPDTFDGAPKSNPDRWLKDMERYLKVSRIEESRWVLHSIAYLRESASTWVDILETTDGFSSMIWADFCKLFIDRFRPLEASRTARSILKTIRQRTSVDEYNNRFRDQIKYCSDMAMEDQLLAYMGGLKPDIESELYRQDPTTLEEAMRLAVRMDMRLFIRNRERNSNTRNNSNSHSNNNGARTSFPRSSQQHTSGSAPMDLSSMGQDNHENEAGSDSETSSGTGTGATYAMTKGPTPNLSSEEYARCRKAGICFRCKQKGHISRNCPSLPPKKY
jgi:hypothetical protein